MSALLLLPNRSWATDAFKTVDESYNARQSCKESVSNNIKQQREH